MFDNYRKIIVFDTETTGLDFTKDQIIELAYYVMERNGDGRLESGEKQDIFIKLHNMEKLPEKITELTHITDEMLEDSGIDEKDAAEMFKNTISGEKVLLVAQNSQFDLNMVYGMFERVYSDKDAMSLLENCDHLDTLTVVKDRKAYPHKLEAVITHYGLDDRCKNSHRAIDDCMALVHVLNAMNRERPDIDKYINCFGVNPKYGLSGMPFHFLTYKNQFFHNGIVDADRILPLN